LDPGRVRIVCTSRWLAGEARRSAVLDGRFEIEVIPGAVDTHVFRPLDRAAVRSMLDIPTRARVLLFVAHDPRIQRKGLHLLQESLRSISDSTDMLLLSLGREIGPVDPIIPHIHLGFVGNDHLLAMIYNAADLYVIPSQQDNLPTTVMESMAWGTPVLGFDEGGIPDMVRGTNGRVVPAGDTAALALACEELLRDPSHLARLGETARELAVREYSLERQARDYELLYSDLIN
jgi:glycosyltransferase involved in cell wall biosynthesis